MKFFFSFLLLLISTFSFSQYSPKVNGGAWYNRIKADSATHITRKYSLAKDLKDSSAEIFVYGDTLYFVSHGNIYSVSGGMSIDTTSLSNRINAKIDSSYLTVVLSSYLQNINGIAAGGDLSGSYPSPTVAQFNGLPPSYYLNYNNLTNKPTISTIWGNITGTLSNQTDLNSVLNQKVKYTDTSGMLANYLAWLNSLNASVASNTSNLTKINNDSTNWNTAYNKRISSTSLSSSTLTITLGDGSTVTTSVPTFNQNTTGSAASLTTSRYIYGNLFNGSADVTGTISDAYINSAKITALIADSVYQAAQIASLNSSAPNWNTAYANRITGYSSPLSISGNSISISQASSSTDGYLSHTDWSTFNGKQNALGYTAENTANKGAANGYASLDGTSKIPTSQLPSLALNSVWTVSSQSAMLALSSAVVGDVAVRSDSSITYVLKATDYTKPYNWVQLLFPTAPVSSVNGLTGAVNLTTNNISESGNLYYTDARARAALSFSAGSGAYNSSTGVITIPTNTNQLTNGANYITTSSLSVTTNSASGGGALSYSGGVFTFTPPNLSSYLTANQTITLSGDISGSGTTAITGTLATVNSNTGSFGSTSVVPIITVNGKGLITAVSTGTITPSSIGAAASSGSVNYIQNGTSQQSSSNFYISGTGKMNVLNVLGTYNSSSLTASVVTSNYNARFNNGGALSLLIGGLSYTNTWLQSIQDDGTNNLKNLELNPLGGTVNINGYLALTSNNYSSYALPLSGGTLTGNSTVSSNSGAAAWTLFNNQADNVLVNSVFSSLNFMASNNAQKSSSIKGYVGVYSDQVGISFWTNNGGSNYGEAVRINSDKTTTFYAALSGTSALFGDALNTGQTAPTYNVELSSNTGNPLLHFSAHPSSGNSPQNVGGIYASAAAGWVSNLDFYMNSNWGNPTVHAMNINSSAGTPSITMYGALSGTSATFSSTTSSSSYTTGALVVSGGVGIAGAVYANSTMNVSGYLTASGGAGTSDIRLKTNIVYNPNISILDSIDFIQYNMKDNLSRLRYGNIAQQVEKYYPDLVLTNDKGTKAIMYDDLQNIEIHELHEEVKALKKMVYELQNQRLIDIANKDLNKMKKLAK